VPDWAKKPIRRFLEYHEESGRLLHMSINAVARCEGMPQLVAGHNKARKLLIRLGDEEEKLPPMMTQEQAEELAKFAKNEIERDFPLLHAHTLMGLWSALEVMVEDMLVAFLMNDSEILKNEAFSKIRLPLSEFKMLEKEERMRFLINEFERNQGTNRKHGVDMFEILFEPFGLGGTVKPEVKKNMREMHHVRNVWCIVGIKQTVGLSKDALGWVYESETS
jgi:hypothetical protein